jgi:type VI protein secretion system component VasK
MATQAIAAQGMMGMGCGTRQQTSPAGEWVAEHNARVLAAQRGGRRGPTPEALFTKFIDNSRLTKMADPARAREMRTFAGAMAVLLSLLLLYGWQHFSAIEYGYRIATERQQMQQMEEQNHELSLTQAQLASPARIDELARALGLTAPQPGQVVLPNAETSGNTAVMAEATPTIPAIPASQ